MATKDSVKKVEEKGGLGRYFKGVKSEFKKVVWPTPKQILKYSVIVIVVCILVAILLAVYDKIVVFLLSNLIYN